MFFSVNCDQFAQVLSRLQGFLASKPLTPVLSNVLLQLDEQGVLNLYATDLELSFHGTIPVKMKAPGSITVDGQRLFAIVRQMPEENVVVELHQDSEFSDGEHTLKLTSGRSEISLMGIESESFPEVLQDGGEEYFTVRGGVLKDIFDRTFYAMNTDLVRPGFNGLFFESTGDCIRAVSIDGHRLALVERDAALEGQSIAPFDGRLIPRKGVSELKKLVEEYPEVSLAFSKQHLHVKTPDFKVQVRLIADDFVKYQAAIPKELHARYTLPRAELLNCLKRLAVVLDSSAKRVGGMRLDFQGDEVIFECSSEAFGKVIETLKLAEGSAKDELTVGFNIHYLRETLSVMKGQDVEVGLAVLKSGTVQTGVFKDLEFPQDIYLISPMSV